MAGRGAFVLLAVFLVGFSLLRTLDARVDAIYVFGDSTVDVGNNNYLPNASVLAKANYPHYGIDFINSTPTGRFSNGLNSVDFLAKRLGFPMSPPPFLSLTRHNFTRQMFNGINFASGGSGILDSTGFLAQVIPMVLQVQYFATVSRNLSKWMGSSEAANFMSRCLFLISTGSNDMLEYSYSNVSIGDDDMFLATLTSKYEAYLRTLYSMGARKFGIVSVPPLGCCPSQRARNSTGGCFEELNELSRKFHPTIGAILEKLQAELKGLKYALGNGYELVANIIEHPKFKELQWACCGNGTFNGQAPCGPTFSVCSNRAEYLFWDWFHPTEAASKMAAKTLYNGNKRFVTPITIKQLAGDCR